MARSEEFLIGSYLLESASLFGMMMEMGAPVVFPSNTPERISALSDSVLGEVSGLSSWSAVEGQGLIDFVFH